MALFAVGLAVVLRKSTASQRIHAEGTNEMFGMPLLLKGVNTLAYDGLSTTSTQGASLL